MLKRTKIQNVSRLQKLSGILAESTTLIAETDISGQLQQLGEDPFVNFTVDEDMQAYTEVLPSEDMPEEFFEGAQSVSLDQLGAALDQLYAQLKQNLRSADANEVSRIDQQYQAFKQKVHAVIQELGIDNIEDGATIGYWGVEYDANIGVYLHVEW